MWKPLWGILGIGSFVMTILAFRDGNYLVSGIFALGGCFFIYAAGKASIDPGWRSLQQSKTLWQHFPDLTPHLWYGQRNIHASTFRSHASIHEAKLLIQKEIDYSYESHHDPIQLRVNKAIAFAELGLICRAINEFPEARQAYKESLEILEGLGGICSDKTNVLSAYRETVFRLAELDHVLGIRKDAIEGYKRSLQADEILQHNDPSGEMYTRNLLEKVQNFL